MILIRITVLAAVFWVAPGTCETPSRPVCAKCHPKESVTFLASAMGRSIGPPASVPGGKVVHQDSGSVIAVDWSSGQMRHRLSENGLAATYTIAFQIGAGQVGQSYLTQVGDYLLESPVSFYKRGGWDISPGFENADLLDFNRVIGSSCLACHSDGSTISVQRRLMGGPPTAISCDRCHGDTSSHLRNPTAGNVINPTKLPRRARDSVCEQCHLEGFARVLNPGKTFRDFHPGEELENTWTTYVGVTDNIPGQAVSHAEQLALSRCASQTGGKLWCGTCHNPHSALNGVETDRHSEIRAICSTCHAVLSKADHPSTLIECESCHMPRRSPTDVTHAAITDHRILKRSVPGSDPKSADPQLRAWFEPPEDLRQRNLGLGDIEASAKPGWASLGPVGASVLSSLATARQQNDPAVLAAIGSVDLAEGRIADALPFLQRASELEPANPEFCMYTGIALKATGNFEEAARELNRSIDLDPSRERSYLELSALLVKQHRLREAAMTLDRYLQWNPQGILIRLTRETVR